MLVGQSIFHSVLERLRDEAPPPEPDVTETYRIRGLNSGFVADILDSGADNPARMDQAYLDNGGEPVPPPLHSMAQPAAEPAPPPMPPRLLRLTPDEIAAELSISPDDTPQTLGEKRRAFARDNHPDTVFPAYREQATIRMTIANLMIDTAIRRLSRP